MAGKFILNVYFKLSVFGKKLKMRGRIIVNTRTDRHLYRASSPNTKVYPKVSGLSHNKIYVTIGITR
jgi:hypothetical protein